jgi:hypothetical protein
MKNLVISDATQKKLTDKHNVTRREVEQCFDNKCGANLIDEREGNKTDPETLWFISETNKGRPLKVVYIYRDGKLFLKTAYEPNEIEIDIYDRVGKTETGHE